MTDSDLLVWHAAKMSHTEVMPPGLPFIAIGMIMLALGLVALYMESVGED
jgi:hypothetical protein